MPPNPAQTKTEKALAAKVKDLRTVEAERDMYPYLRDLLTQSTFGIGLRADQIVVDSPEASGRDSPDLAIYNTRGGKAIRTSDHVFAVFEVKRGSPLATHEAAIYEEKKKYVQPGTHYFFLVDQDRVIRRDVAGDGPRVEELWTALSARSHFLEMFGCIGPGALRLEDQLERFRQNKTRYAYRSTTALGRHRFIATVREVAQLLNAAILALIDTKVVPDARAGEELLAGMRKEWGDPVFDWGVGTRGFPIEFTSIADEDVAQTLTTQQIAKYQDDHDRFAVAIEPHLYAVQIERQLLQEYARRAGVDSTPSLLAPRTQNSRLTDSGRAVESFAYETASLIVSRMLMVRFSEDHGFLQRYISNGGVEVFSRYAAFFKKPMQALLRETYNSSRELYRNLFDQSLLDWALDSTDEGLSDALLHAMYLLSRWDFRTVQGDILSGVYDHYLDTGKRRALGEVFTRPEIARYMLGRCNYAAPKTVLDPACGTGTFLVEVLAQEIHRFQNAGMLNVDTIVPTLRRLHGLDINPFSVALAQIQILWHLIELFTNQSKEALRTLAAAIIPAITVHGGHSSLDPLGSLVGAAVQPALDLSSTATASRRKRVASVPRRFRQISQGQYDIVIGNPPYVRAHRQLADSAVAAAYEPVHHGQMDLYIPFIYRSLKNWLKPGGRLALIVPIAVLDARYAERLRSVLREYKIVEIADMECLRKKTFRGIKRPTVILVIENTAPKPDDDVELVTLYADCFDVANDVIDFGKGRRRTVKREQIEQSHYLPDLASQGPWAKDLDPEGGSSLVTKLAPEDVRALETISKSPRLGDIVRLAYRKQVNRQPTRVALTVPEGEEAEWQPTALLNYGLKLGGKSALTADGAPVYKGQNVFPSGLRGEAMGRCDSTTYDKADHLYIYLYRSLFDTVRMFVIRTISQLPTACRLPADAVFQNTVFLTQLVEDFPLHIYLLSRAVQWYCAKLLRSSIVEDLTTTWVKKHLLMIPIPAPERRTPALTENLERVGEALLAADQDLADAHRHVDDAIRSSASTPLVTLLINNDPRSHGLDLHLPQEPVPIVGARECGMDIVGDNLLFKVTVSDAGLRRFMLYTFKRMLGEDPEAEVTREDVGRLSVPTDLTPVIAAIEALTAHDRQGAFDAALTELDEVVGPALGLGADQLAYVIAEMQNDGFLKELRPMYAHRGLRVQPYADHSESDRYQ